MLKLEEKFNNWYKQLEEDIINESKVDLNYLNSLFTEADSQKLQPYLVHNANKLSYSLDSPGILGMIFASDKNHPNTIKIKRSNIKETARDLGHVNEYSLSFSTDLLGHAERKPDKWGCVIIIDNTNNQAFIEDYAPEDFEHAQYSLKHNCYIDGIAATKSGDYYIMFGNGYGVFKVDEKHFNLIKKCLEDADTNPDAFVRDHKLIKDLDDYKENTNLYNYKHIAKDNLDLYWHFKTIARKNADGNTVTGGSAANSLSFAWCMTYADSYVENGGAELFEYFKKIPYLMNMKNVFGLLIKVRPQNMSI